MTERCSDLMQGIIRDELGINPPDGYCLPLAIIGSLKSDIDEKRINYYGLKSVVFSSETWDKFDHSSLFILGASSKVFKGVWIKEISNETVKLLGYGTNLNQFSTEDFGKKIINLFYPNQDFEYNGGDVAVRDSKDVSFYDILHYAFQHDLPIVFVRCESDMKAGHAVSVKLHEKHGEEIAELQYGIKNLNERPEINISKRKIIRDGGFMSEFFQNGFLIVFPPFSDKKIG